MTQDLTIQAAVVVNSEKAEQSFDRLGDKATHMAAEVASAAGKAGQAVDGIGAGAEQGAERFTRAEARMRDSIKRSTQELQLLGKTASEKFEFNVQAKGLDATKLTPYIEQLKQAEAAQKVVTGSLDNMGISAKQTAFAMRGVPAQFTDIITSLQGGQAPMTVLLQQGGQLKDMFGGVGNAAKALGGYVVGMINPLTLAAAAVAGLGFAMASANSKESEFAGLSVRLSATGRGALSATGDLKKMIEELNRLPGVSRSAAASIIDEFSRVQGVGTEIFKGLGSSVADFAAATGTDLPTAAKKLAAAFADPAKGAKDLETALGTLSAEQLLTIEKMAALGDKTGAQTALLDALQKATKGLANDAMTPLGRATDSLSNSWDGLMKSVGNSDALKAANVTLSSIVKYVAFLLDNAPKFPTITAGLAFGPLGAMAAQIGQGAGAAVKLATPNTGVTGSWAAGPSPASELDGQVKDILEATTKYKSTGSEIAKVKAIADQAKEALAGLEKQNRGTSVEAQALRDRIGGLNEELIKLGKRGQSGAGSATAGESELASIRARVIATQRNIDAMKEQGLEAAKQTEGERLVIKIQEELAGGLKGVARANKEKSLASAEAWAALQKEESGIEKSLKLAQQQSQESAKQVDAIYASAESTRQQAIAQEAANGVFGKGKTAIEELTLATQKNRLARLESLGLTGTETEALKYEIEQQERKVKAFQGADYKTLNNHTDELLRNAKEQASLYQDELRLTGLTALERAKVVAQRQIEIKYAKELADLEKKSSPEFKKTKEYEEQVRKLNEARQIEGSAAVARVVQDDWAKTADQINQSLTDALMRGFESGKSFAMNLRDTLVNMFKTLVLRPVISFIVNPISQAITGVVSSLLPGAASAATGSGGTGLLGSVASTAANYFGFGGAAAASTVAPVVAGGVAPLVPLVATNVATGAPIAGGLAGMGKGVLATLGSVPVYGWIAAAVVLAVAALPKGDSRFGSQGSYTPGGGTRSNGGPNGANDDFGGVSAANKASALGIDKLLEKVGSKDRLGYFAGGFESSEKGKGFSYAGGVLSNGKTFGQGTDGLGYQNNRGSMNAEEAKASYINELKQATLQSLQAATDIPKSIADKLAGVNIDALSGKALDDLIATVDKIIGEVDAFQTAIKTLPFENMKNLSFDAAAGLIEAAGGLDKLSAGIGAYYQAFYSEGERAAIATSNMADEFAKLGIAVPENEAAYRKLLESIDVTTPAGQQLAVSVGALAPAFKSASDAAQAAAQRMSSVIADYASASEVRDFEIERIRKGLADGGVNLTHDQIANANRQDARALWETFDAQARAGDASARGRADAVLDQAAAFAKITENTYAKQAGGIGYVGSGGGGGGGGGSVNDSRKSAADAIVNAIKDLQSSLLETGPDSFARLQAQYAIDVARAKAGDIEAAQGLPALVKSVAQAGKEFGNTSVEQAILIGGLIESMAGVVKSLGFSVPGFAAGTNYVPQDMLAVIHQGEAIIPRAYNPANGGGQNNAELVSEIRALREEVASLRYSADATASATQKTARTLDSAANGGQPLATLAVS